MMETEAQEHELPRGRGFRHVALRVTDLGVSKTFYRTWFGMTVVWEPDAGTVYMSSGEDNLALHQRPREERSASPPHGQVLDHLGFIMDSPDSVDRLYRRVVAAGVTVVRPPTGHRDGSYSFYLADPDRIVIQILYEPRISAMRLVAGT